MKFSSILVAALLQHSVHAAAHENPDIKEKRHSRLGKKRNHQRNSQTVRHFTLGAKSNLRYARKHQHKRNYHTKIVGGDESDPDEFPYYGKRNEQEWSSPLKDCLLTYHSYPPFPL
jgi:hypothetical protein